MNIKTRSWLNQLPLIALFYIASPVDNIYYLFEDYLYHYFYIILFFVIVGLSWRYIGYTGKVYSGLFFIGYVLRVNLVISDTSVYNLGGHYSTGDFIINGANLARYYLVSLFGFVFVLLGSARAYNLRGIYSSFDKEELVNYNRARSFFLLFFIIKISLIFINSSFLLSISGISAPQLPFKLTGAFNLLNNYFIPFFLSATLLLLFRSYSISFSKKLFYLFALVGLGALESLVTHSKITVVLFLFPLLLSMLFFKTYNFAHINRTRYILVALAPFFILMYLYVDIFRSLNINPVYIFEIFSHFLDKNDGLRFILDGISARLTGGSELMGVISYFGSYDIVWLKLMYSQDFLFSDFPQILGDIYGVSVGVNTDGSFSGKSIGLLGILYLDKNFLIYALACFFVGYFVRFNEMLILRSCGSSLSFTFVSFVLLNLSESGFDIFPYQYLALVLICLVYKRYLIYKSFKLSARSSQVL